MTAGTHFGVEALCAGRGKSSVIRAYDVVGRRGYCDHFVMMYVCVYVGGCVGVHVSTIKRKPLIGMS